MHSKGFDITDGVNVGGIKWVLFAGPCVIESEQLCMDVGGHMKEVTDDLGLGYIFKASFDKANRTSYDSFRGPGLEKGLEILEKVRSEYGTPIVTDVHEAYQASEAGKVVDVIQIPAFLCRQTDLLVAAGDTGKTVKIKKGQFMAAEDMKYAADKVRATGNEKVLLTERGTTFGYHNLSVDFRSFPVMREYAPVIFDVTHSVQQPGGAGGSSSGQRQFAPYLAKAAAAVGVDGFFMETHPDPSVAKSDGPNMIPLNEMRPFLEELLKIKLALGY